MPVVHVRGQPILRHIHRKKPDRYLHEKAAEKTERGGSKREERAVLPWLDVPILDKCVIQQAPMCRTRLARAYDLSTGPNDRGAHSFYARTSSKAIEQNSSQPSQRSSVPHYWNPMGVAFPF